MIAALLPVCLLFAAPAPISASHGLAPVFRELVAKQQAPGWIAYRTPMVPGDHQMCWHGDQAQVSLEGPKYLIVLVRAEHGEIGKLRTATSDCRIDPDGLPLTWIEDVSPADSVALLKTLAEQDRRDLANNAMIAIMLTKTGGGESTKALIALARWRGHPDVQKQAFFWLAHSPDPAAFDFIDRLLTN